MSITDSKGAEWRFKYINGVRVGKLKVVVAVSRSIGWHYVKTSSG